MIPAIAKTASDIPKQHVRLMDVPEFIPMMVEEIANGGSLIDLAARMGIPFEYVNRWIHTDPIRSSAYQGSLVSRAEWFQQRILRELRDMCFVDPNDIYASDGTIKPMSDIPEGTRRNIASIETVELFDKEGEKYGELKKVKLWDKSKSVETAMKHLKLLGTDIKVTVSGSVVHTVDSFDLEERIRSLKERKQVVAIESAIIIEKDNAGKPGDDI